LKSDEFEIQVRLIELDKNLKELEQIARDLASSNSNRALLLERELALRESNVILRRELAALRQP